MRLCGRSLQGSLNRVFFSFRIEGAGVLQAFLVREGSDSRRAMGARADEERTSPSHVPAESAASIDGIICSNHGSQEDGAVRAFIV